MGEARRRQQKDPNVKKNKFGLVRNIPLPVKREIRKRCGFGCITCGCAIYQYEHVDPVFSEAKEHDSSKMALLCGSCHQKVTSGMWSKDRVKKALENPKCLQTGFSFDTFDLGSEHPTIVLGNSEISNTSTILEIHGEPLIKIEPPEENEGPFRLSALFYDRSGKEIFRIAQNEWQGPITNWDIEIKGRTITVRDAPREIILVIHAEPPNKLVVEELSMFYKGARITASKGSQTISWCSQDGAFIGVKAPKINMTVGASFPKEGGINLTKL